MTISRTSARMLPMSFPCGIPILMRSFPSMARLFTEKHRFSSIILSIILSVSSIARSLSPRVSGEVAEESARLILRSFLKKTSPNFESLRLTIFSEEISSRLWFSTSLTALLTVAESYFSLLRTFSAISALILSWP